MQMTSHRCRNCGHVFEIPDPPKPLDILTTTKRYIPLEEFTHVTCPACGYEELASERKFFGVLGPRGLQILVGAIVLGVIIAVIFSSI
jgi:rubredoxin